MAAARFTAATARAERVIDLLQPIVVETRPDRVGQFGDCHLQRPGRDLRRLRATTPSYGNSELVSLLGGSAVRVLLRKPQLRVGDEIDARSGHRARRLRRRRTVR